jgi:hypothetical protein
MSCPGGRRAGDFVHRLSKSRRASRIGCSVHVQSRALPGPGPGDQRSAKMEPGREHGAVTRSCVLFTSRSGRLQRSEHNPIQS